MGADVSSGTRQTQSAADKAIAKSVTDVNQAFANQLKASSSSQGGQKDPLVYMGSDAPFNRSSLFIAGSPAFKTASLMDKPATLTSSEAKNAFFNWDEKTRDKFLTQLNLAGYDTTQLKDGQISDLWGAYVDQAARYYQDGNGKQLTPWDILAKDMYQRESYMKKPRTVTQTSTQSNLSTTEDAHAIFLTAAQSLLGRDPTKGEISSFQKTLNSYEQAHPTVTTQTSKYIGDELQSQSSKTTGGVSADTRTIMAQSDVKADPEFGAYQAATTYFDALQQMIGGGQ